MGQSVPFDFSSSAFGAPTPLALGSDADQRSTIPHAVLREPLEMSDGKFVKVDGNEIKNALTFLRGLYPAKTAESVSADTGISVNTVNQWLRGNSRPGWIHTIKLVSAYGPEFLAAACPGSRSWSEPVCRQIQRERALEAQRRIEMKLKELGGQNVHGGGFEANGAGGGGVSSEVEGDAPFHQGVGAPEPSR